MIHDNPFAGGIYGLLTGDALGVPYEFHTASEIPAAPDMIPPAGFPRTYPRIAPGTWSDDGAQALCLLDSLVSCGSLSLQDFAKRLLAWFQNGYWAVDGITFDVGAQTADALDAYARGTPAEQCGMVRPDGKGNGALMRVLPLALWHRGTDEQLVMDAHQQCLVTHGHLCNQVCCALYCLTARFLMNRPDFDTALQEALHTLRTVYKAVPDDYTQELDGIVSPDSVWEGRGTGYVVDTLHSAFMIMRQARNYRDAVLRAVRLGNDTDTTACVTGGLAGIRFGFDSIPSVWYDLLRGKDAVDDLLRRAVL